MWVHFSVVAIGKTHQAESLLQYVTISVNEACRGGDVEWIPFEKSPLGDSYLPSLSDDMQRMRG